MPDNASAPQATLHEIRTAANSAAFLLPALISMKEDSPGVQLLDVGAGSGTISTSFAELLPGGHVIAVDINVKSLARAQALAEKAGIKNIDFRQGSVYELPFADESFDITFCHQVLIHIGNPWDALREMLRVTKRNGIVAAREGDYETESIWPSLPGLTKFHDFMASLMSAGGGSPTAGRELLGWALRAHVSRDMITLSHSTTSYSTAAEKIICSQGLVEQLRAGTLREKASKLGLHLDSDCQDMVDAWVEWAGRDDASLAMLHGEIIIRKER